MPNERCVIKIDGKEASDLYPDIINLEVEVDIEAAAVFNLNLPLNLDGQGQWSFIDDQRLQPWAEVQIEAGFENEVDEIFRGFITHIIPHIETELSKSYLAIRGMDFTIAMDTKEILKAWPDKMDSEIAHEIFSSYGLEAEIQDTGVVHDDSVSTILQRETDIRFLKRLARRNGFECFVEKGKGFFRSPNFQAPSQKVLAIHFGEETNLSSFKAEVSATRPFIAEMSQLDPRTREEQNGTAIFSERHQLGATAALDFFPADIPPGLHVVRGGLATNPEQMQKLCQALVDESSCFVEAWGEIVSHLYDAVLKPRQPVAIKGVGERFSGIYYVTNIRHKFAPNNYTQRFCAKRNALNVTGSEDFRVQENQLNGVPV
jgi:phage protein D